MHQINLIRLSPVSPAYIIVRIFFERVRMAPHSAEIGIPESAGIIHRIWSWAKESSAWYTRLFAVILILTISAKFGYGYFVGNAPGTTQTFDYWTDKAFILVCFFAFLLGAILREFAISRKERYANIFDRIESISASLRDLNTYIYNVSSQSTPDGDQFQKTVHNELSSVMDNISELFSMLTGTTCRTAVKCIFNEADNIYVYSVTRDRQSNRQNEKQDKERFEKRRDKLVGNDDFDLIFREQQRWFIDNNLSKRRNYRNTSFLVYGSPPQHLSSFQRIFNPGFGWTLPYKAAMVFPIEQRESASLSFDSWGCIGFLAIDSAFGNVFKPRFDGPLGASLANALFAPLSRYVALLDAIGAKGIVHVKKT